MKLWFILFFFFLDLVALCQENRTINKVKYKVESNFKGAFLLPHSPAINSLMNGTFPIYEVGVEFQNLKNEHFNNNFPFHKCGIVANFSPLTGNKNLGFCFGLVPYINMNIHKNKITKWRFRIGFGLGYIQKPFDNIKNPKNMAIGTHINNITDLTLLYQSSYEGINLSFGLGLQHLSNGAFSRPNLGLNLPYLCVSLKPKNKEENKSQPLKITDEKNSFFVSCHYGSKTLTFPQSERFHVFQFCLGYTKGFDRGNFIHFQADIILDNSVPKLKNYDYQLKYNDKIILGLFSKYEKRYGDVGLFIGLGFYLLSPYKTFTSDFNFANNGSLFYSRVGAKYQLNKKICLQASLRAHWGEADNAEIGITYKFK
tara:strand:- start:92 stop:1201 length:1110 start_codon:yes stop_codon:yes gene_type:complete